MKKYFLKPFTLKLIIPFVLIIVAFVIHSCRKDNKSDSQTSPAITEAKTWYENAYPVNNGGNSKLLTQSTGGNHDLSQWVKPDWQHATTYSRLGQNVIEMPFAPGAKLNLTVKTNTWLFNKAYSRSYYLLLNDGKKYQAYILTIIADSDYVKNDLTKLAHNTYRKHDADFSGLVLYFTPKGSYLGGYGYKNGQLVTPATTPEQTSSQKIQSITDGKLKPNNMVVNCTDWYQQVTYYYSDGTSATGEWQYLSTTCTYAGGGGSGDGGVSTGGSSGSTGGGGSGGSSPSSPPPPPPCPAGSHPGTSTSSPCTPTAVESINDGQLKTRYVQPPPPGDGGLPPPPAQGACSVNTPAKPCATITIKNNVNDLCLKKMVQASIDKNIEYVLNETMKSVFGSNTNFNLTFLDDISTHLKDPTESAETNVTHADATIQAGTNRTIFSGMDITITINKTQLANASKEYITATIIHEAFHAYLTYSHTILNQHLDMAQNYMSNMTTQLMSMYPTLDAAHAKDLTWGGLEKDSLSLYTNLSTVDKNTIEIANTNYRTGTQGTPCGNP